LGLHGEGAIDPVLPQPVVTGRPRPPLSEKSHQKPKNVMILTTKLWKMKKVVILTMK
jgi:hypothetical protein